MTLPSPKTSCASLDPCLSRDPGSCHGCYRISHRQPDTHATSRQQTAGLLSDRSSTQFVIRPTVKLAPITRGALFWCQSCLRIYVYILQPVPPEIQLFSSLTAPHASPSRDASFRLQCQGEVMKQIHASPRCMHPTCRSCWQHFGLVLCAFLLFLLRHISRRTRPAGGGRTRLSSLARTGLRLWLRRRRSCGGHR